MCISSYNYDYFFLQDNPEFAVEMFWIFSGAEISLLSLSLVACLCGFIQLRKLSHSALRQPYDLDVLLSGVTSAGAYIYAMFRWIKVFLT